MTSTELLPESGRLDVAHDVLSGPEFYNPHDDQRLQKLIEPHRVLFEGMRDAYAEALGSVLCHSGLDIEFRGAHGHLTMSAWHTEISQAEPQTTVANDTNYSATHIKARGVAKRTGEERDLQAGAPPFLVDEEFDLADILPKGTVPPDTYLQVDTVLKVTTPLARSAMEGAARPRFEHEFVMPDGSTVITPYFAQKRKVTRFPSFSEALAQAIPSGLAQNFDGLVGVATEKARRRIAMTTWEEQFAEAFNEGNEPAGVPRSTVESVGSAKTGENGETDNPLRHIARYAGAGMLAELDNNRVVDVFMDHRVRQWANALLAVTTDPCDIREELCGRARWAADYGEAFQTIVEQRLGGSPLLIRDHIVRELVPLRQVASEASAFAFDIGNAPMGQTYDGGIWRKVAAAPSGKQEEVVDK